MGKGLQRENGPEKYIFVTGGVLSSLGKGLSAAAIGALLQARGIRVTNLKMDPYINVDPGTMSPYQHGEVFVTDDGTETDLDLGHYERFTGNTLGRANSFTTGRVYKDVIDRERRGEFLGRTVQVIPHVTDEIKGKIKACVRDVDVGIVEVGGTVGDIESLPFLEAIRQFRLDVGPENVIIMHVTPVLYIKTAGELKTKPTQHSVKELLNVGIQPDVLLCRCDRPLPKEIRQKIAGFCNVSESAVIAAPDVPSVYMLPMVFHEEGLGDLILQRFKGWAPTPDLRRWKDVIARVEHPQHRVRIGVVGKYVHLADTYKSLNEALAHGGLANRAAVEVVHIDSEELDLAEPSAQLTGFDAILVPGGFGNRGVEGKIAAIRYARTHKIPFFGICLGLQVAVIEFARSVLGASDANSREFDPASPNKVIELMDEQHHVTEMGGTMRLGAWPCLITSGTLAHKIYGSTEISERHRHRYEVNPAWHDRLTKAGMVLSGTSAGGALVEMIELPSHPYFVACQFHPEFKSRPLAAHPLFTAFVAAAVRHAQAQKPVAAPSA